MPLHNTIQYYTRQVYGNMNIYLSDPTLRDAVQMLTGKKTVSDSDLENLGAAVSLITGKQVKLTRVFDPSDKH
jgi:hypothetical protein